MENSHLRPVDDPTASDAAGKRAAPRQRPGKSLPTDRMKMEVQIRVLQALGRLSGQGKRTISIETLAQATDEVSKYTVALSNNFFVDVGWLEKKGRGEYAASDALALYTMRLGNDPSHVANAIEPLTRAIEKSWVWRTVRPMLISGSAPLREVRLALMQEAEAGSDHVPQLNNVLEWLRYANLISISNDQVRSVGPITAEPTTTTTTPATPIPAKAVPAKPPADPQVSKPTTEQPAKPGTAPVVISLAFSVELTAADIAKLSGEQIKALFDGVGAVVAVRNAL